MDLNEKAANSRIRARYYAEDTHANAGSFHAGNVTFAEEQSALVNKLYHAAMLVSSEAKMSRHHVRASAKSLSPTCGNTSLHVLSQLLRPVKFAIYSNSESALDTSHIKCHCEKIVFLDP